MSGSGITPRQIDIAPADLRELRRMGLALECCAASFTGIAQRVESGQASIDDFERAAEAHSFARDNFRDSLERATGLSAAAIERWMSL